MRAIFLATGIVLSIGSAALANQPTEKPAYTQICDSARLRAVERADCHAQMKAAANEEARRDIFRTFDRKINGALAS